MMYILKTNIGRLRIIGFLEGTTLLILIFIAVPMKYIFEITLLSKMMGPIHGGLFILYLLNAFSAGIEQNWSFKSTTWKIIAACFIPFGTFYIDHKILKKINSGQ